MQKEIIFCNKNRFFHFVFTLMFFFINTTYAGVTLQGTGLSSHSHKGLSYSARTADEVGKYKLKIGIVDVKSRPYLFSKDNFVEGVIPDFLIAMEKFGSIDFEVLIYSSKDEANADLLKGNIDLFASFIKGRSLPGLLVSQPLYTPVYIEVVNKKNKSAINSIAVVTGSVLKDFIAFNYLDKKVIEFESDLAALEAVDSGRVDMYIGTLLGSRYLVDYLRTNKLKISGYPAIKGVNFSLVTLQNKKNTMQIVDEAIALIPSETQKDILKHWGGSRSQFNLRESVKFSDEEIQWISKNTEIKYVAFQGAVPFMFSSGRNSKLTGFTVDLIDYIAESTGLIFKPVIYRGDVNIGKELNAGYVDVFPFSVYANAINSDLVHSKPYANFQSRIYARENDKSILSRGDLRGRVVARSIYMNSNEENLINPPLSPEPKILTINDNLFSGLLSEQYDAVVINSIAADYMLAQKDLNVRYIGLSNDDLNEVGFSARNDNKILIDIIDKSLKMLSRDEMDSMQQSWASNRNKPFKFGLDEVEYEFALWVLSLVIALFSVGVSFATWKTIKNKNIKKKTEDELDLLRSIVNALPFSVFVTNVDGDAIICNEHYLEVFNLGALGFVELPLSNCFGATNFLEEINQLRLKTFETKESCYVNKSCILDNKEYDLFMWMIPLATSTQSVPLFLGGWQDISEQKINERALEKAKIDAESANLAKDTFLAVISHEIRTPMNAILGLIELQIKRPIAPDKDTLRVVYSTANSLLALINDILDYSKAESGLVGIEAESCSIDLLIGSICNIYKDLAIEKGVDLIINSCVNKPDMVWIDPLRFKQLIGNLIGNALKFTDCGFVMLNVDWEGVSDSEGILHISIKDSGKGISPENKSRIFDAFEQEDDSIHEKYGGSGLGLWICNKIINEMQGTINVESAIGEGTVFHLLIPVKVAIIDPIEDVILSAPKNNYFDGREIKVLIVDDHPANILVLQQQFKYIGLGLISFAENGKEALELLDSHDFDIIVTDCFMPVMDGFQLARAVRLDDRFKSTMIIGFTADARNETHKKAISAGMDACLTKPVSLEQLTYCLEKYDKKKVWENNVNLEDEIGIAIAHISGSDVLVEEQFLTILIDANKKDLEHLLHSINSRNFDDVFAVVHRIKGAAHLIKAKATVDLCVTLENALTSNDIEIIEESKNALNYELIFLNNELQIMLDKRKNN